MRRSRRQGREAALRSLYQMEVGRVRVGDAIRDMKAHSDLPNELLQFAESLVAGVHEHQAWLDDTIAARVLEWDFERIAVVDRNLLRLSAFELFFCEDIPPAVSINEAIDLAKKYSTPESGKFVNGVLGKLLADSPKSNWDAGARPDEAEEPPPAEEEPQLETIEANTPEEAELSRLGMWKVRSPGGDS